MTRQTLRKKIGYFIDEFLQSSSIHGLGHLAPKKKHYSEYLLWLAILASAITGLSYMGMKAWWRYQHYPTVIYIEKDYKNWNTSFAALMLCPKIRNDPEKLRKIAEKYGVTDNDEFVRFFMKLSTASYSEFGGLPEYSEIDQREFLSILHETLSEFTFELSNSNNVELMPLHVITENGICYAINTDIGVHFTYRRDDLKLPIKRGDGPLLKGNNLDGIVYVQAMRLSMEYNVTITGPYDLPDVSVRRMSSEMKHFFLLEVNVLPIISSDNIRSLSPRQRKCRFFDESNLGVSNVYSYNLCRMQCRADLAFQLCNCIPYFYKKTRDRPHCDDVGMRCLGKHAKYLTDLRDPLTNRKFPCTCLPLCNDVHYVVIQENLISWPVFTHLKCTMSELPRTRLKREVIFGFGDFLVSIGGSAGLFLGCSVLSFIEIVYFLTIRLFLVLRAPEGKSHWIQGRRRLIHK